MERKRLRLWRDHHVIHKTGDGGDHTSTYTETETQRTLWTCMCNGWKPRFVLSYTEGTMVLKFEPFWNLETWVPDGKKRGMGAGPSMDGERAVHFVHCMAHRDPGTRKHTVWDLLKWNQHEVCLTMGREFSFAPFACFGVCLHQKNPRRGKNNRFAGMIRGRNKSTMHKHDVK